MRRIVWANRAKLDYWDNISYLQKEWTEKEVKFFISEVDSIMELLQVDTVEFQSTGYKNTFRVPVVTQIVLFYFVDSNNVVNILRFFNANRDPGKLVL